MILAFNKPYGILSQFTPQKPGQQTLSEFNFPKHVYPVGRLDLDSEGLLLLSDEARINQRLLHPRFEHERTYHVQVDGDITDEALSQLRRGVSLTDYKTQPCRAERLMPEPDYAPRNPPIRFRKLIPTSWISLAIGEGKNRQVRRMTAAVGFPTLRLIRVAIGGLPLGDLKQGTWYALNQEQIRKLLENPKR